jgi:peptidoglycan/xylan/chitin deacetylase (PgdA/CDA1 family)
VILDLYSRLKRRAYAAGANLPGVLPTARRSRTRDLAIVMYHGVTATPLPAANWCQLAAEEFARQLDYLKQHYTLLPLREAVDRLLHRKPLPPSPAVLTFDDGFRNVFTTAYPLLERHQAPATVFLVTGLIGTRQPAWPEQLFHAVVRSPDAMVEFEGRTLSLGTAPERAAAYRQLARALKALPQERKEVCLETLLRALGGPHPVDLDSPLASLDWPEIETMHGSGLIEFGSHTHTHPILSRCRVDRQEQELRLSRDLIRERLGRADLFAYPNGEAGDFTTETQQLLRDLGYVCAVATQPGLNDSTGDRYALRRVHVGADTDLRAFRLRMIGL